MEQNHHKFDIIKELLVNERHVRSLAESLGTNHMTIARKLKELAIDNVVDYKPIGKNKIYFLKNSLEARAYTLVTEVHKLLQALKKHPSLRLILEKIQKDNRFRLAILFGSYAKGTEKKDSDVDIYIETEDPNIKKELSLLDTRLSLKIGKYDATSPLAKEIVRNHIIIKGIEGFYEKNRIFD